MNFYNKAIKNKYFLGCQRGGVIGSFAIIYLLLEPYVFPISDIGDLVYPMLGSAAYIWIIKGIFWDNNLRIKEYPIVGTLYTIIGIPITIFICFFFMLTLGFIAIFVRENYENTFDNIIINYIAPLVSILFIVFIIIQNI